MTTPTDDQLLDFDSSNLADYDETTARATLAGEHGDTFRNQLVIARWLSRWVENMDGLGAADKAYQEGYERALREVAAHLRQGDLLPGAVLYEEGAL